MLGLGVKLNTGSFTETDDAPQADGTIKNVMMDQAIQPVDGGIGISVELQGFKQVYKNLYGFVNGYYLFNPKEHNGSFKSAAKAGRNCVCRHVLTRRVQWLQHTPDGDKQPGRQKHQKPG